MEQFIDDEELSGIVPLDVEAISIEQGIIPSLTPEEEEYFYGEYYGNY